MHRKKYNHLYFKAYISLKNLTKKKRKKKYIRKKRERKMLMF